MAVFINVLWCTKWYNSQPQDEEDSDESLIQFCDKLRDTFPAGILS